MSKAITGPRFPQFLPASTKAKRLKVLIWGPSGSGKTTLALQAPRPAVIDLEGGSELYGDSFPFDVSQLTTADEVMDAVNGLMTTNHDYQTVVIDPITVYWEALQRKWSEIFLQRNRTSKGFRHEYYDFQPKDWMTIKDELRLLMAKLVRLDMHVIAIARQKPLYADGGFMRVVGDTFDCEKSIPYVFDTVIQTYCDEKGKFMAKCHKDRTHKLPTEPFEISYDILARHFGPEILGTAPDTKDDA